MMESGKLESELVSKGPHGPISQASFALLW